MTVEQPTAGDHDCAYDTPGAGACAACLTSATEQPTASEPCPTCGPGYRYGDDGCRHEQPTASAGDVERLASALRYAGVEVGYVGGDEFRKTVARRLLRSDWLAERERAAEQRGREDNADHDLCYVSGSEALAAKLADAFDEGKWAAYTAERDGLDGSEVHNFYRDRIENGQQS